MLTINDYEKNSCWYFCSLSSFGRFLLFGNTEVISSGSSWKVEGLLSKSIIKKKEDAYLYQHKKISFGEQSSIFRGLETAVTISSVTPLINPLQSHITIQIQNSQKKIDAKIKLSLVPEFEQGVSLLMNFDDLDYKSGDEKHQLMLKGNSLVMILPRSFFNFKLLSSKESISLLDLMTRSQIKVNSQLISANTIDKDEKMSHSGVEIGITFNEKEADFFGLEFFMKIAQSNANFLLSDEGQDFKEIKDLSFNYELNSLHRPTLKKILSSLPTENPTAALSFLSMTLMKEAENLLPKEGVHLSGKGSFVIEEKKSFLEAQAKLPMPLMAMMSQGPEISIKGEIFEKIFPFFLKDYLVETLIKSIGTNFEWTPTTQITDASKTQDNNPFGQMLEAGMQQEKKIEKMKSILSPSLFNGEEIQRFIGKASEMGLVEKNNDMVKLNAQYSSGKLTINSLPWNQETINSLDLKSFINLEEVIGLLEAKGFQYKGVKSSSLTQTPGLSFDPSLQNTKAVKKLGKLENSHVIVFMFDNSGAGKEFENEKYWWRHEVNFNIRYIHENIDKRLSKMKAFLTKKGISVPVEYQFEVGVPSAKINEKHMAQVSLFRSYRHFDKTITKELVHKLEFTDYLKLSHETSTFIERGSNFRQLN